MKNSAIRLWREGMQRPLSSAYADTFPEGESKDKAADARHFPRRGKQERGLRIKRLFEKNA